MGSPGPRIGLQNASHPYHGNYEGSTQAGSWPNGEAIRVLAAFRRFRSLSRGNYEGSTQAESWPNGEKQVVSWLHLGGSNPYHGAIMKDPHKLDPGAMERSNSCLAAFRRFKSLSRGNYEGSTQAGSWRHGKKQFVSGCI